MQSLEDRQWAMIAGAVGRLLALDEDKWITVHPNGSNGPGAHVKIGEGGEVKAGLGGKFNGKDISEVKGKKGRPNSRTSAHEAFGGEKPKSTATKQPKVAKEPKPKAEKKAAAPSHAPLAGCKLRKAGDQTKISFPYDPERVQRFKAQFKTAKFDGQTKEWSVKGATAEKRLEKWLADEGAATESAEQNETKARSAAEVIKHPFVTQSHPEYKGEGAGYSIRTPYSPELAKLIKSIPGAKWNADGKRWIMPFRSAEQLKKVLPEIDKHAKPFLDREAEQKKAIEKQRADAQRQYQQLRAEEEKKRAETRQSRMLFPRGHAPGVGQSLRRGNKVYTVTGYGKPFRIDEDRPSYEGSHLLGHEGDMGHYAYYREATPSEVKAHEDREASRKH